MNKSLATNLLALLCAAAGLLLPGKAGALLTGSGLFALAGAVTNWLAIHMLFEKVPGFYGSGVIPARFTEFRAGIRTLVMEQFFNVENVQQFFNMSDSKHDAPSIVDSIMAKVDFNKAFDGLVEVIMQSSFAGMLAMVGGANALKPLRDPFVAKMQEFIHKAVEDKDVLGQMAAESSTTLLTRVEAIVDKRLEELTPELVKEIIDRKSTRLNSSHITISYAVFCLKKKNEDRVRLY